MRSDVYREHWNERFHRAETVQGAKLVPDDQFPDQPTFYARRVNERAVGERPQDRHVAAVLTILLLTVITAFIAAFAYIPGG